MYTNGLECFNGCTSLTNLKAPASGSRPFSAVYIVTEGRPGPRAWLIAARLSISRLRDHKENYEDHEQPGRILMVEDDPKDVELTLTALRNTTSPMRSLLLTMANKPSITCIAVGN